MVNLLKNTTQDLFKRLESNGYQVNRYTYPENLGSEEFFKSIVFSIYLVDSPETSKASRVNQKAVPNTTSVFQTSKAKREVNNPVYSGKQSVVGSSKRISDTIALFLQQEVKTTYGIDYTSEDVTGGVIALSVSKASLPTVTQLYRETKSQIESGTILGTLAKQIKQVGSDISVADVNAAMTDLTANLAINSRYGKNISIYSRIAKNQYLEFAFNNVQNRAFEFAFNFSPKNPTETQRIKDIITTFKKYALPKVNNLTGALGIFYEYPAQFDISFLTSGTENDWLPKISTCVLANIDVTYGNANDIQMFKDMDGKGGAPTHITLSLRFTEMEALHRDNIDQGF